MKNPSRGETFFVLLMIIALALTACNIILTAFVSLMHHDLLPMHATEGVSVNSFESRPTDRKRDSRTFHTAVTADGSVYNTWQCRVMYYWYMKNRGADMGGFTRILHSGHADHFVDEMPTFVAQPLPAGVDEGYVVLNRPWGLQQWLEQADIKEEYVPPNMIAFRMGYLMELFMGSYIWMAEPDHLIVKPIPNLARQGRGAAFRFHYIDPERNEHILARNFPDRKLPVTKVHPVGNSPVIIEKAALKKIVPTWVNISLSMKRDKEADKAFGWVLEMYAYAMASAYHGTKYFLQKNFMIQPPWETEVGNSFIIHYTFGCDYDLKGNFTPGKIGEWRFDKRSYDLVPLPKNLPLPPQGVPQSVVTMIRMFNEATANIPNWYS